jgi:flagellar motility protein MotE (MotC chaperone)
MTGFECVKKMFAFDSIDWFAMIESPREPNKVFDTADAVLESYTRAMNDVAMMEDAVSRIKVQTKEFLRQSRVKEFHQCLDARDATERCLNEAKRQVERRERELQRVFANYKPIEDNTVNDPYHY